MFRFLGKNKQRKRRRVPSLEGLESRQLLTSYLITGKFGADLQASFPSGVANGSFVGTFETTLPNSDYDYFDSFNFELLNSSGNVVSTITSDEDPNGGFIIHQIDDSNRDVLEILNGRQELQLDFSSPLKGAASIIPTDKFSTPSIYCSPTSRYAKITSGSLVVNPGPSTPELYAGAAAAYGLSTGTFTLPAGGWKELQTSPASQMADGFAAVAVRDPYGNLIILNEGTVIGGSTYDINTTRADLVISTGKTPLALKDAAAFALSIQKQYGGTIYVAGHSLGGIEAEMECKTLGVNCGGGATFGATGLPGNTSSGPKTLSDFVDYGDPVGNASTDSSSPLASLLAPANMLHFGNVIMIGSQSDATALSSSANSLNASLTATDSWVFSPDFGGSASDAELLGGLTELGIGMRDHGIAHYGADLNLTAPVTAPPPSPDVSFELYGIRLGAAGFRNFQQAVVQTDGSLVSPDFTVSFSTSGSIVFRQTANVTGSLGIALAGGVTTINENNKTGLISSITYVSSDRSIYSAALDSTRELFSSLQVNENTKNSYYIVYDLSNKNAWTLNANFYNEINDQGTVIQDVYNWDSGGSQVQTFNNIPKGYTKRLSNYSGLDGTGKLISVTYA